MVDLADHIALPVPNSAHHVRIIAQPEARGIRRAIAPDRRAEHSVFRDVVEKEFFDARIQCIELRMTAAKSCLVHQKRDVKSASWTILLSLGTPNLSLVLFRTSRLEIGVPGTTLNPSPKMMPP
jgi:hypothetical protein